MTNRQARQWTKSFRGMLSNEWPRVIWQELFDIYRHNDGTLGRMNDLLIDFESIKDCVDMALKNDGRKFTWGMDPEYCNTTFVPQEYIIGDKNLDICYLGCEIAVFVSIRTQDEEWCAEFEEWRVDV